MAKQETQTLELTQVSQTVQWLDEERRKDKTIIAALQEQMNLQKEQLSQQAAQIQDLRAIVSNIQVLISKASEFEETVARYKSEVAFMLEQHDAARKKEEVEADRLRKIEAEAIAKQIDQLDRRTQVLRRFEEDRETRLAEERRLNETIQRLEIAVADLNKRADDRSQAVTYLEEQRRSDNRRLAELEQETIELRKKLDAQAAKALLLEEMIQKQKQQLEKVNQLTRDFQKVLDEVHAAEFQREQAAKKHAEQAEMIKKAMDEWRAQTQRFTEQYQLAKRAIEKLEGFQGRLEKRQNEVAEMQRLAEDRLKRQWEEWQAAQEREQKRRQLMLDEQWKAQQATDHKITQRVERLEAWGKAHYALIESLLEALRTEAQRAQETALSDIEQMNQLLTQARDIVRA